MPTPSDDGGLIKLIIIAVVIGVSLLAKFFAKKQDQAEGEKPPPGGASGGRREPVSPEQALERMFQERQRRKNATPQPVPQARPVPRQTLDQYLGTGAPPARPAVPMARPVHQPIVRKPAPPVARLRKSAPLVARLRRPQAALARPSGPTVAAEQSALMAHSKARVEAAAALAGPNALKPAAPWAGGKPLVQMPAKWDRLEAAKAMAYLEVFGPPRSLRPYSGPPAAG